MPRRKGPSVVVNVIEGVRVFSGDFKFYTEDGYLYISSDDSVFAIFVPGHWISVQRKV